MTPVSSRITSVMTLLNLLDLVDMEKKVKKAVEIALQYGAIEGSDHRMWVIDQMLRALLGAREYKRMIHEWEHPEDGDEDEWDVGVPP